MKLICLLIIKFKHYPADLKRIPNRQWRACDCAEQEQLASCANNPVFSLPLAELLKLDPLRHSLNGDV